MIIDGFIFYNELDLLEMRLEELDPVVDKFFVVSASKTFRGEWKPKSFNPFDARWDKWRDKIVDFEVTFPPAIEHRNDPWEREAFQRNEIGRAIRRYANLDDIVIISDVDEIPRREVIKNIEHSLNLVSNPVALSMRMYYYKLNVRQGWWSGAKVARLRNLGEPQDLRHSDPPKIAGGGWHFSYLGDEEFIANKIKSFAHSELDTPKVHAGIKNAIERRVDLFGRDNLEFAVEQVNDTWPHAVRDNPDFWSKHVW